MTLKTHVRVIKEDQVFSAGHFITYNGGECERLHGHNYRVRVDVHGPLDENCYVYDFIALRHALKEIIDRLDHRMLLPTQSRLIAVTTRGQEVEARFGDRRWVFPLGDCILLPIANTTAELLAGWIATELRTLCRTINKPLPPTLCVHVEENFGQWAVHEETSSS